MRAGACRAGLYLRLSKDDEGNGESVSITNQRILLTEYVQKQGWEIVDSYIDDGWSGTSFERPAFQRMLADIERGRLDVVLTKDLSRLGRDYIQTGQYTEVYFPSKRVRYIAVNDGFDTARPDTDMAPFRHVVNEMYARDTSRKIRSSLAGKMRQGSYIGSFAPYGYQKDPENKNRLVPDEAAAAVVREIFNRAAGGERPGEIAAALTGRGVAPPLLYRCICHPELDAARLGARRDWAAATVSKILKNRVYLGHTLQGKTEKVSFKSKLTVYRPPEEWVVVEHTHEPLVSEEGFHLVQFRRRRTGAGAFSNLFSGIARCARCGSAMSAVGSRKKDAPVSLACGAYKLRGKEACSNHFIAYNVLYEIVLEAVWEQLALTPGEREELYRLVWEKAVQTPERGRGKREALEREAAGLERMVEQLYEDRLSGRLSQESFYLLLEKYEGRREKLRAALAGAEPWEARRQDGLRGALSRRLEEWSHLSRLDSKVLFALIDHIEVGQGRYEKGEQGRRKRQEVKIVFRFDTKEETRTVFL